MVDLAVAGAWGAVVVGLGAEAVDLVAAGAALAAGDWAGVGAVLGAAAPIVQTTPIGSIV